MVAKVPNILYYIIDIRFNVLAHRQKKDEYVR